MVISKENNFTFQNCKTYNTFTWNIEYNTKTKKIRIRNYKNKYLKEDNTYLRLGDQSQEWDFSYDNSLYTFGYFNKNSNRADWDGITFVRESGKIYGKIIQKSIDIRFGIWYSNLNQSGQKDSF